jgi:hypothetical protein
MLFTHFPGAISFVAVEGLTKLTCGTKHNLAIDSAASVHLFHYDKAKIK